MWSWWWKRSEAGLEADVALSRVEAAELREWATLFRSKGEVRARQVCELLEDLDRLANREFGYRERCEMLEEQNTALREQLAHWERLEEKRLVTAGTAQ